MSPYIYFLLLIIIRLNYEKMMKKFEILDNILHEDRDFMNKMFNRRHLITHTAGVVDQEYLNNTNDSSVKLNQAIRIRSKEIRKLLPLVKKAAINLIERIESMK